jgi:hypothetical protein
MWGERGPGARPPIAYDFFPASLMCLATTS